MVRALQATPGPTGGLSCRAWRSPDDGGDLVEGHREDVVKHERNALGWSQHVKHHEQRGPNGLGKESLVFGVDVVRDARDLV